MRAPRSAASALFGERRIESSVVGVQVVTFETRRDGEARSTTAGASAPRRAGIR